MLNADSLIASSRPRTHETDRTSSRAGSAAAGGRRARDGTDSLGRGALGQLPLPDAALAQDAGMTLEQFEVPLRLVLIDWDAERERMTRIKELFDGANEVHIVGAGTDLRLSLSGRNGRIDAGGANMPGGEVFYSPVEDSAEGTIEFSEFPGVYVGREVNDIRFRFAGGGDGRGVCELERGLSPPDARHRRRRTQARRAGHRLQPRHHPPHEERGLRREDRWDDPPRCRQGLPRARWHERERRPLGHRQGPAAGRAARGRRAGRAVLRRMVNLIV